MPVFDRLAQFFILYDPVAGDLINPKVFIQILEVILLEPAREDQDDDFFGLSLFVITQDGYLDGASIGSRCFQNNLA